MKIRRLHIRKNCYNSIKTAVSKPYSFLYVKLKAKDRNKDKNFENIFSNFFDDEKDYKTAIQKGVKMSDYSTLRQLKERFEQQLVQLKKSKNGNNSKQIKYVEDWILKLDKEMKEVK